MKIRSRVDELAGSFAARKRGFALALGICAAAQLPGQSGCSGLNLLTARSVNLKPTASSHINVARQSDGSYTAFELTDASPYTLIVSIT